MPVMLNERVELPVTGRAEIAPRVEAHLIFEQERLIAYVEAMCFEKK